MRQLCSILTLLVVTWSLTCVSVTWFSSVLTCSSIRFSWSASCCSGLILLIVITSCWSRRYCSSSTIFTWFSISTLSSCTSLLTSSSVLISSWCTLTLLTSTLSRRYGSVLDYFECTSILFSLITCWSCSCFWFSLSRCTSILRIIRCTCLCSASLIILIVLSALSRCSSSRITSSRLTSCFNCSYSFSLETSTSRTLRIFFSMCLSEE